MTTLDDLMQQEQPELTCADLARITKRPAEFFQRLARTGKLKSYRDLHGVKTPYRFKKSEFIAFWLDFQKETKPWQGIDSFGEKINPVRKPVRGWRGKDARGSRRETLIAKRRIDELRRSARMRGMSS